MRVPRMASEPEHYESAENKERADRRESAVGRERAVINESTVNLERAEHGESIESLERSEHTESTEELEYLAAWNRGDVREVIRIIRGDRKTRSYPPIQREHRYPLERDIDEEAEANDLSTRDWLRSQQGRQSSGGV